MTCGGVHMLVLVVLIAVMMKSNAVKLKEGIGNFVTGSHETAVQRYSLQTHGHRSRATEIDTFALLEISEIERLSTATEMWYDGRLHVADERPLCRTKERVGFDVRSTSARSQPTILILDQELSDERFAEAVRGTVSSRSTHTQARGGLLGYLRSAGIVWKRDILTQDIRECRSPVFALERGCAVEHLIYQDAQRPPIHRTGMTTALDNFGRDVLLSPDKRVGSEVCNARSCIDGR